MRERSPLSRGSRRALRGGQAFFLLGLGLLLPACQASPHGKDTALPTAVLTVKCDVQDAVVWIDDRMAGEVAEVRGGIRLLAGPHRVEVRHDNYYTRYQEVVLQAGREVTSEFTMIEVVE